MIDPITVSVVQHRLGAIVEEMGEAVLDGAERQARAVIAEWPDGEYEGVAHLDDDGHGFHDIHIRARVTVRGSDLRIDRRDSRAVGWGRGMGRSGRAQRRGAVAGSPRWVRCRSGEPE